MINEELEEVLVIGEDDFNQAEVDEYDDYLIVQDPESQDDDSWCVLVISGEYENFVIRFEDVSFNAGTGDLAYVYNILSTGEEDREYDPTDFSNFCTGILSKIMVEMHEQGTQQYEDIDTE